MMDPPSNDLRRNPTDQAPSGTKWVDNKKPIFCVELLPATTVHPLDNYIGTKWHKWGGGGFFELSELNI